MPTVCTTLRHHRCSRHDRTLTKYNMFHYRRRSGHGILRNTPQYTRRESGDGSEKW